MSSKITLRCPGCNAQITAPAELLGMRRSCPGCGTAFVIGTRPAFSRPRPPRDSDPMLVTSDWLNGGATAGG